MKRSKGNFWIVLGLVLLVAAVILTGNNLHQARQAESSANALLEALKSDLPGLPSAEPDAAQTEPEETPDYLLFPDMEMPVKTVDGMDLIGVLSIPALHLELPILSRWSDSDLNLAPCRYSGSAYAHDLVLAGHNYPAHFGALGSLCEGDSVVFTDMDGNVFRYRVAEQERLFATSVEAMTQGDWDLTLFTCTVDGQSRVTVRCVLADF